MPKVSIIIPTYNRATSVQDAIKSILKQTFTDYEIIVVDDGSTDNTKEIIKEFDGDINYIYQKNEGPSSARNTGILAANGKYIAFLDSDDLFLPSKLKKQVDYLNENPDCKFLYSWYLLWYSEKGRFKKRLIKSLPCKSREALKYSLFTRKLTIRTSTVLIEKELIKSVGFFNNKYLFSQDWDMWLRIAYYTEGHCIEEPLSVYIIHDSNRSTKRDFIHHPEIISSTMELYGWNEETIKTFNTNYWLKEKEE